MTVTLLPQLIAQRAREHPDRVYIDEVGAGSLTFGQLHESALRWGAAYRRAGVDPGDRVLTMLPLGLEFFASAMGLAWVLGIEAPVNVEYRGQLLLHAVRTSQPQVIVAAGEFVSRFEEIADQLDARPLLVVVGITEEPPHSHYPIASMDRFLAGVSPLREPKGPDVWDIASIMYTSGTTGPSKGVMMPWGQLCEIATRPYPDNTFDENDCYYLPSVTYHMSAKGAAFTMALVNGRLAIRDRFSVSNFFTDVERYRCTIASLFGAAAQMLYSADRRPDDASTPLSYVLMSPALPDVDGFSERFGLVVTTGYGMTETGPVIGGRVCNDTYHSCGQLRSGYEVRLVDEHDFEVPDGQIGELIVRSDAPWTLNQGYFGMPAETASAWRNGWFHTGDAMRRDAHGNFYFVDRLKDSIRRRGENISSFEVEAIVNSHPDVAESAAVAVPSPLGEDDVKIVVVCKAGIGMAPTELIDFLVPRMPRFMVPRYVEFVDSLPKTPTDRVQKALLRAAGITASTWDREGAPPR